MTMTAIEKWEQHLERCNRCQTRPFDLCLIGAGWFEIASLESSQHQGDTITSLISAVNRVFARRDEDEGEEARRTR